jgi:chorismate-pyruvate lyase
VSASRTSVQAERLTALTALLTDPSRLVTAVLEDWCGKSVSAKVLHRSEESLSTSAAGFGTVVSTVFPPLAEVSGLLRLSDGAHLQLREVGLGAGRGDLVRAEAVVVLDRVTTDEVAVLRTSETPLGIALSAGGVRRRLAATPELAHVGATVPEVADTPVLIVTAVLCRETVPVALVRETFLRRILE